MLLKHIWLAELIEPGTITEEDEEAAEQGLDIPEQATKAIHTASGDEEVGTWVRDAIERRRSGKMGKGIKPALHAAPLDAVPSPTAQR
jgi:mitogen-activated protein kinase kinase